MFSFVGWTLRGEAGRIGAFLKGQRKWGRGGRQEARGGTIMGKSVV